MNSTLSVSLNGNNIDQIGLISSLAFVSSNNNVANDWILSNVPSENASEAFLLIKTQLHNSTNTKLILNIMNLISQLGNNENYKSIIKHHSFHIISHLITRFNDSTFTKSIIDMANSWVKLGLLTNEELESVLNPSKTTGYDDNLTAGEIASLINDYKKSPNWHPYTPVDYKAIVIKSDNDIKTLVDQCVEELDKFNSK